MILERPCGQPVLDGDVTVVGWLNDPDQYVGGELIFTRHDRQFKPLAGSVLVFPAVREAPHAVAPISKGERFSLVSRIRVCH